MSIATLRPVRGAAGAALVALFVAACGPGATPTPPPAATTQPTQAPGSVGPIASPAASQPAASQLAASATVSVVNGILVGPTGMALYTKSGDSATSSTCSGGCLAAWPALTVAAGTTPTAGPGAGAALATFTRSDDGTSQVTYNGLPLYYFASDTQAGVATGDGVGGFATAKP